MHGFLIYILMQNNIPTSARYCTELSICNEMMCGCFQNDCSANFQNIFKSSGNNFENSINVGISSQCLVLSQLRFFPKQFRFWYIQ